MFRNIPIGDQMNVEKAFSAVAGAQEIHLAETAAPPIQPKQKIVLLIFSAIKMHEDINVAGRTCGGVLCAAKEVEGLHAELPWVKFGRNSLCHAETPAPMLVRPTIHSFL